MSENNSIQASNELIHWLKMLSLPTWAKWLLGIGMLGAMCGASWLLIYGLANQDSENIASGVTMLTIGMPISLIVIAMIFGQGGEKKLRELTQEVLEDDIDKAILSNIREKNTDDTQQLVELKKTFNGCVCEYSLTIRNLGGQKKQLDFKVELNVHKANVVIWASENSIKQTNWQAEWLRQKQSCLVGAENEGYKRNEHVAEQMRNGQVFRQGFVFIKQLDPDFLLKPTDRLYFSQDFAFFVRSLIETEFINE
jgi:hypothetical protein